VNRAISESFTASGAIEAALEDLASGTAAILVAAPVEAEGLDSGEATSAIEPRKFVSVYDNPYDAVEDEQIRCLIDGVGRKMLKRYLRQKYNLEWEEYLAAFDLPSDYPSVAPKYSDSKRQEALDIGLGSVVPKTPRALRAIEEAPAQPPQSTSVRRRRQRDAAISGSIQASRVAA
jgi:predicted transcriptional regulator